MTFRPFALAAACAASALALSPAIAHAADQVTIEYQDLDLSTQRGLAELDQRTERAAEKACAAGRITTGTIMKSRAEKQCYKETLAQLRQQMAQLVERETRG